MGMHFQIFSLTVSFHLPFSNMAQIGPDARKNARAKGDAVQRFLGITYLVDRKIVLLFYSFTPFAFYKFGSDGFRYEALPASATRHTVCVRRGD